MAMEQQQRYGIPASVTLAQMYVESAGGRSKLAREGNNFFGIKCTKDWLEAGKPYSLHNDDKPNEKFCNYSNVADSVTHHSQFLMQPRYAKCRQCASDDYIGWTQGLQEAHYATTDNYATSLQADIKAYGLDKYDRMAIEDAKEKGLKIGFMRGKDNPVGVHTASASFSAIPPLDHSPAGKHWSMPLASPDGEIVVTSGFGHRHTGVKGASTNHNGLDLRARYVPILATEDDGRVVNVSADSKSGKWVRIEYDRNDGTKYRVSYAHLDSTSVKEGDTVMAGQQLGVSGASGLASAKGSAPHLHFVVRKVDVQGNSCYLDPTEYLAEIAVRGNLCTKLVKKGDGSHQDLLAQYKSNIHLDDSAVPQQPLLAQQEERQIQRDTQQLEVQQDMVVTDPSMKEEDQLLATLTRSDDPHDWLKYLMAQNNDHQVGSGDLIADLISVLFAGVIAIAAKDDSHEPQEDTSQQNHQGVSAEIDYSPLIARKREGVDTSKLRQMASMQFEAYSSEESPHQGVRLS